MPPRVESPVRLQERRGEPLGERVVPEQRRDPLARGLPEPRGERRVGQQGAREVTELARVV
jgi:hypothetical protein